MDVLQDFYDAVTACLRRMVAEERANFEAAGEILAKAISEDRLIHVIGTGGHSYLGAEDFFERAGGLFPVEPIFEPSLSLSFGALRSGALERLPGLMERVMSSYDFKPGDPLVIVNAYGINTATIDAAMVGRRKGLVIIAITSKDFQSKVPRDHPARHPSGKNLFELADVTIDSKVPFEDALLKFEGLEQKVSPVSTILNSFAIQALVGKTVEKLLGMGIEPPVWTSANIPGGDEKNARLIERYRGRVRYLWRSSPHVPPFPSFWVRA